MRHTPAFFGRILYFNMRGDVVHGSIFTVIYIMTPDKSDYSTLSNYDHIPPGSEPDEA